LHRAEFKTVVGCAQRGDISHLHTSHRLAMQQAKPGREAGFGAELAKSIATLAAQALLQVTSADGIQPGSPRGFPSSPRLSISSTVAPSNWARCSISHLRSAVVSAVVSSLMKSFL